MVFNVWNKQEAHMKAEDFSSGEPVIYIPRHVHGNRHHQDCEHGIVSSQNGFNVFVRYYRNSKLQHSAQATSPDDLVRPNEE